MQEMQTFAADSWCVEILATSNNEEEISVDWSPRPPQVRLRLSRVEEDPAGSLTTHHRKVISPCCYPAPMLNPTIASPATVDSSTTPTAGHINSTLSTCMVGSASDPPAAGLLWRHSHGNTPGVIPLTSTMISIYTTHSAPPLSNLPQHNCEINFRSSQIAVSSLPFSCHFVVLIAEPGKLYWVRANERRWSSHPWYKNGAVHYWDRFIIQLVAVRGKFYALTSRGRLGHIDLDRDPVLVWRDDVEAIPFDQRQDDVYRVECEGELLAVIVRHPRTMPDQGRLRLSVYRLDTDMCAWVGALDMVKKDKVLFLARQGSMCRKAAGGGGKVYTAGYDSFRVFDLNTCKGSAARAMGPVPSVERLQWWSVWVSPEPIRGERRTSRWVAVALQVAIYLTVLARL